MRNTPFLPDWNFQILKGLFLLFPHDAARDAIAQFFVSNSLASSWIYAAVFYVCTGGLKMSERFGNVVSYLRLSLRFARQLWQHSHCGHGLGCQPQLWFHVFSNSIPEAFGTPEIRTVFRAIRH
jgi:hypothetical protein